MPAKVRINRRDQHTMIIKRICKDTVVDGEWDTIIFAYRTSVNELNIYISLAKDTFLEQIFLQVNNIIEEQFHLIKCRLFGPKVAVTALQSPSLQENCVHK